jgi:hypothetical protein
MTNSEAEGDDFDGVFASIKTKMFSFVRSILLSNRMAQDHTQTSEMLRDSIILANLMGGILKWLRSHHSLQILM